MSDPVQSFDVVRFDAGRSVAGRDRIAAEAPLEVRLEGQPFSVIMRTPGADEDLAAGFLFSEGVVSEAAEIQQIDIVDPNIVNVSLAPSRAAAVPDLLSQRRQVVMNSSCGMCGRRTLESLDVNRPPLAVQWSVPAATIEALPAT